MTNRVYLDDDRLMETLLPAMRSVLQAPDAFFRDLPPTHRYRGAILLLTAISMVSVFLSYPFYGALMLFLFPVVWIGMVVGLLAWARYLRWCVRRFSDDGRIAVSNAFLLSSYASVPLAAMFVPWLGAVASLWSLYLMWRGVVARGKVAPSIALMLVLFPMLLPIVFLVGALMLFPQLLNLLAAL